MRPPVCTLSRDSIKVCSVPSPKDHSAREGGTDAKLRRGLQRAGSLRSLTGLTEAEFEALLPHFEQAIVTSLQDRTIDGQPRTSRR
jgi:hypothetical protein